MRWPASGIPRPLAYTGAQRNKLFPDVPTVKEATGIDHESGFWFPILGPARVPQEIVVKVRRDTLEALKIPEISQRYDTLGFFDRYDDSPAQIQARVAAQIGLVERMVAQGKIKVQ
jgi:tripartite-type tricarboxylate transporter receptor subunit TctC